MYSPSYSRSETIFVMVIVSVIVVFVKGENKVNPAFIWIDLDWIGIWLEFDN